MPLALQTVLIQPVRASSLGYRQRMVHLIPVSRAGSSLRLRWYDRGTMRVSRIYLPVPLAPDSSVVLTKEQAHYLGTVLRLRAGAAVILFNGDGAEYDAVIASVDRRSGQLHVQARREPQRESSLELCLALGISRGERMTYAIQKAVELGVTRIQPLITEYCEVRVDEERAEKRQHHWLGVVHSACEQSGRTRVPQICTAQSLDHWLTTLTAAADLRLALDPRAAMRFGELPDQASHLTLLVGPEGGLSETDLTATDRAGFTRLRLGPRILRTETAAVAALVAAQLQWGDLR